MFSFDELRITQMFQLGWRVGMVKKDAVSNDFRKQALGHAQIVYRLPDRRWLLQSYVRQIYDLFPNLPALRHFLAF